MAAFQNSISDGKGHRVGARPRAEGHHQDAVAGLGHIQNRGQPHDGRAGVGVADDRREQADFGLFGREAQRFGDALGEFGVGLVEDRVGVICGGGAGGFHEGAGRVADVVEVGRFAGEAHAVFGVVLVGAAPEVRGVGDEGKGGFQHREAVFRGADDESRAARRGGVF